jgi:hypothetical protein
MVQACGRHHQVDAGLAQGQSFQVGDGKLHAVGNTVLLGPALGDLDHSGRQIYAVDVEVWPPVRDVYGELASAAATIEHDAAARRGRRNIVGDPCVDAAEDPAGVPVVCLAVREMTALD